MCIDNGIETGWIRAHKHIDSPDDHSVKTCIYESIIAEVYDWFKFEDVNHDN
jgi:hypothetical protein